MQLVRIVAVILLVGAVACGESKSSKGASTSSNAEASKAADGATAAGTCSDPTTCNRICSACVRKCKPSEALACHRQAMFLEAMPTLDLDKIAALREKACFAGHGPACAALAVHYMDGRGKRADSAMAASIAWGACQKGTGVACFNLALWERSGLLANIDEAKAEEHMRLAEKHYQAACARGEHVWCMNLGVMYEEGFSGKPDPTRAEPIYRKSCAAGHVDSCVNLSLLELRRAKDHTAVPEALPRLERACSGATALACGVLGQLYIKQRYGIPKDPAKAVELLKKGCAGGAKQACAIAGAVYALGDDVKRDMTLMLDFERRACDLGDAVSCFGLASNLRGAGASGTKLVGKYLERACNIGHAHSCELYASMLSGAAGVKPDPIRAAWARLRACRRGAMRTCAQLLRAKVPLPLPPARAQAMRARLCMQGVREACTK